MESLAMRILWKMELNIIFFIEIVKISGIPRRLRKDVKVSFKFNGLQRTYICPDSDIGNNATASSVDIYYRADIPITMDNALREYLESGMLVIEVYGCPSNKTAGLADTMSTQQSPKQVSLADITPLQPITKSGSGGPSSSKGAIGSGLSNPIPAVSALQRIDKRQIVEEQKPVSKNNPRNG
eukprot:gnl/Chilomastix_caulleri/1650.p1 GENE.gnl/Chilomastix_caulleri/1650~~gnl/Chilomastix_caulleri/1650.p1  ORF type:complete len:182 (+),score=34.69 gnl/Chilomastix_caulleri/1650:270-815(+)